MESNKLWHKFNLQWIKYSLKEPCRGLICKHNTVCSRGSQLCCFGLIVWFYGLIINQFFLSTTKSIEQGSVHLTTSFNMAPAGFWVRVMVAQTRTRLIIFRPYPPLRFQTVPIPVPGRVRVIPTGKKYPSRWPYPIHTSSCIFQHLCIYIHNISACILQHFSIYIPYFSIWFVVRWIKRILLIFRKDSNKHQIDGTK